VPDVRLAWRDVLEGALVAGVLFNVGKWAIGAYLGHSAVASAFGAAGSLVVLLVWVYYSAQILLFGAEIAHIAARKRPLADLGAS
jgi:membrane protein